MTRKHTRNHPRRGHAYLAVFGVILTVTAITVTGVKSGMQRAFTARRLSQTTRAQAIAEAGVSRAYVALAEDFEARSTPEAFPLTQYAGGTYDVDVWPVGDDMAAIRSIGTYQGIVETVILDVKEHQLHRESDPENAYGYAILADEDISWTGCGVFERDSLIHANGIFKQAGCGELDANISSTVKITLKGKSGEIDGDAAAPVVKGKTSKVTGTVSEIPVPRVAIPTIDLVPYYAEALANGQVYEGGLSLSHAFAPPGGVVWINGDLHLSGSDDVTGCFIATGDIHLSGSGGQVQVQDYPAFLSRDGDIKISGSGEYEGLVYTRIGDIQITGSGTVRGSIISGGCFKKAGCSTIFTYVESVPIAPDEVVSEGVLVVSAWQQ